MPSSRSSDPRRGDRVVSGSALPADVEEGVALLEAAERGPLVRTYADRYPVAWMSLCREVTEEAAAAALLRGPVAHGKSVV